VYRTTQCGRMRVYVDAWSGTRTHHLKSLSGPKQCAPNRESRKHFLVGCGFLVCKWGSYVSSVSVKDDILAFANIIGPALPPGSFGFNKVRNATLNVCAKESRKNKHKNPCAGSSYAVDKEARGNPTVQRRVERFLLQTVFRSHLHILFLQDPSLCYSVVI
jgi:hypothetical protein